MALPKHLQAGLTPDELTFLAEDDVIDIVPLFSMSRVRLLSGIYGPFTPPSRATVPLWLALSLKRKRKCRIVPPEWLQVGECVGVWPHPRAGVGGATGDGREWWRGGAEVVPLPCLAGLGDWIGRADTHSVLNATCDGGRGC